MKVTKEKKKNVSRSKLFGIVINPKIVLSNNAPDLSVLSVDRWRLCRLGGREYENIIWPCKISPYLSSSLEYKMDSIH